MTQDHLNSAWFERARRSALLLGVLLLAVGVVGGIFRPVEFFRSYLLGFLFCASLTWGALAVLMMQYLSGGAWGVVTRRTLEAATRTLPLLAVMFIPIAFGVRYLYPWTDAAKVAAEAVLKHRAGYMNTPMFIVRGVCYFAILGLITYLLNRWSWEEDGGAVRKLRMERLSAPGLIIYVFIVTFASVDWAESIAVHWYSTMWGFLFVAQHGVATMAFLVVLMALLWKHGPLAEALTPEHFQDLGKLLLTFVMLWAYFAFSQFLIVWSGNLASEISWYVHRMRTTWKWLGLLVLLLQFTIPFLLLLSRRIKRDPMLLAGIGMLLLVVRWFDLMWVIIPSYEDRALQLHWLNLCIPIGMAALWFGLFFFELRRRPLLPVNDPELESAVLHGA